MGCGREPGSEILLLLPAHSIRKLRIFYSALPSPSRLNLCDEKLVLTAVTRDVCYMFLRIVYCRGRSQMH